MISICWGLKTKCEVQFEYEWNSYCIIQHWENSINLLTIWIRWRFKHCREQEDSGGWMQLLPSNERKSMRWGVGGWCKPENDLIWGRETIITNLILFTRNSWATIYERVNRILSTLLNTQLKDLRTQVYNHSTWEKLRKAQKLIKSFICIFTSILDVYSSFIASKHIPSKEIVKDYKKDTNSCSQVELREGKFL